MADGVSFIYGTFNNDPVFYMGSPHPDGFVYFTDREMYRVYPDTTLDGGEWSYVEKSLDYYQSQKWLPITGFKLKGLNFNPGSIVGGGGSESPDQSVEGAVQWAIGIAEDDSHGYDQITRDGGVDYDCSSLVSHAFRNAGFDIPLPSPATYTMIDAFTAAGFTWYPGMGNNVSELLRGDILLNINAHVEIYIGQQQVVGACINEFGGIYYGQPGDQTGQEIRVGGWYSFPWDGVLRKEG